MNRVRSKVELAMVLAGICAALTACAGGYEGGASQNPPPPQPPPTFSIGGSVTGLVGTGLRIKNGAEELSIAQNGDFKFPSAVATGTAYGVTVLTQPGAPAQSCTLNNASGSVPAANVTNIAIDCVTPLTITNTTPADNARGVSRVDPLVVDFSVALDPATISPDSVSLRGLNANVTARTVSGNRLTVTTDKLSLLTPYELLIMADVAGSSGETLPGFKTVSFTTADGAWQQPMSLNQSFDEARAPDIAADSRGNAIAVWVERSNAVDQIWSRRYSAGTWSTPVRIDRGVTIEPKISAATAPRVAMDSSGNAMVIWLRRNDVTKILDEVWANEYTVANGWGQQRRVSRAGQKQVSGKQLAYDPSGSAMAVWQQSDGVSDNIWASRHVPGDGPWSEATLIESQATGDAASPQIAFDSNGNGLAVWTRSSLDDNQVPQPPQLFWNRFTPDSGGTGWGIDGPAGNDPGTAFGSPQLVFDSDGAALLVIARVTGDEVKIWASRYVPALGWQNGQPIEPDQPDESGSFFPQISVGRDGTAMVVWRTVSALANSIRANRYTHATGWEGMQVLDELEGFLEDPHIAMDVNGNALAVWTREGANIDVVSKRYEAGKGWRDLLPVENLAGAGLPRVVVDGRGNAFAVWQRVDPLSSTVWINRLE